MSNTPEAPDPGVYETFRSTLTVGQATDANVIANRLIKPMNQYFEDRLSISRVQNGTSSAESARIINLLEAARLADPNHIVKYHAAFQADKSDKGSLTAQE